MGRGSSANSNHVPPNGGWLGWSQVLGCFFISICSLGLANTFGVFQSHYETTTNLSHSTISWIGTTQGFLLNILGLLSGRLHDLYPSQIRPLLLVGSSLNVVGLLAASFSGPTNVYPAAFLSLGVCVGLGSGLLYVPSLSVVTRSFDDRRRPFACGLAATGAGVGGVVYPVMFRGLLERKGWGFPWAVRSIALVNLCLLALACLLVRPPRLSAGSFHDGDNIANERGNMSTVVLDVRGEESAGECSNVSGFFSSSSEENISSSATTPEKKVPATCITTTDKPNDISSASSQRPRPAAATRSLIDTTTFRDKPFLLFSLALFLLWLGVDIPFFFLPSYATGKLGLPAQWGDHLLSIMNASAIVGRVFLGLAASAMHKHMRNVDRYSSFVVWLSSIGLSAILLACWVAIGSSLAGIIVFVVLYGALTGGVISLVSSALLVICPDLGHVGTRLGMSGVLAGVGFLVGPPIAGAIQDKTRPEYLGQSLFAACTYFAAFGSLVVAFWTYRRGERRKSKAGNDAEGLSQSRN